MNSIGRVHVDVLVTTPIELLSTPVMTRSIAGPGPGCPHAARASVGADGEPVTRRRRPTPYRRLLLGVVAVNLVVAVHHVTRGDWRLADGTALSALSTLTLINITGAVLIRQQLVLDLLYGLAGRGSRSWPLWLRWSVSQVHQVGGLHAGFGCAGTVWLGAFTGVALVTGVRHPGVVTGPTTGLSLGLTVLLLVVSAGAAPAVRARAHNVFEQSHRWGGWAALAMFWALTVHLAGHGRTGADALGAILTDWHVWVLALVTTSIAWPWLRLRRVPITVERPSAHVAIVHVHDARRPEHSSAVGISLGPLREWHAFATVTAPGRSGYRLLISRAGDWTGRFIDDPPTHVWLRGIPVAAPMAHVSVLYERVLYVVTGSGIGPCLGQILANRVPARLVWSTRHPRGTYGDALVDEVEAAQPDAVVWDTTTRGAPDLLGLTLDEHRRFGAEAVFIVSNRATTLGLVADLERRGIPAFGPIWDS